MKYIIASIEDNIARLEYEGNADCFVGIESLPSDVREGDILLFDGEKYAVDKAATEERKKEVFDKFKRLFGKE